MLFCHRSWQAIRFKRRPVTFIKIVGTHNTANEVKSLNYSKYGFGFISKWDYQSGFVSVTSSKSYRLLQLLMIHFIAMLVTVTHIHRSLNTVCDFSIATVIAQCTRAICTETQQLPHSNQLTFNIWHKLMIYALEMPVALQTFSSYKVVWIELHGFPDLYNFLSMVIKYRTCPYQFINSFCEWTYLS